MPTWKIGAVLLAGTCAACTTLQPLADARADTIRQAVTPGDTLELVRTDGESVTLKVESVTDEAIHGTVDGKRQSVLLGAIRSAEIRRLDRAKTGWAAAGVAAVVGIAVLIGGDGGGDGSGGGGSGY